MVKQQLVPQQRVHSRELFGQVHSGREERRKKPKLNGVERCRQCTQVARQAAILGAKAAAKFGRERF